MQKNKRIKTKLSTLHDRLYYFREDNYEGFLLLLFVLVNLAIFIATAIAVCFLPENNGLTFKEILWRSLSYMLDPGNLEEPPSAIGTIVLSIFTIIGMIFFSGGMVAFLSSMLTDYLENLRNGDTQIHYKHFTFGPNVAVGPEIKNNCVNLSNISNVNLSTVIAYKEDGVKHHFLDSYYS